MPVKSLPNVGHLKSILDYCPETGVFIRLKSVSSTAQKGARAGSVKTNGRVSIKVDSVPYEAHRLAWAMFYGEEPDGEIDHINRNPADNRICNLRCVTHLKNSHNRSTQKTSTSGVTGVLWHIRSKRWYATIRAGGVRIYLGCFKEKADAVAARKAAESKYHVI
jgi:hypothetical protein